MKKLIISLAIGIALGYSLSHFGKPDEVITKESLVKQEKLVEQLKSRIKTLTLENVKENTKVVIVENKDGSKVTTRVTKKERSKTKVNTKKSSENNLKDSKVTLDKQVTVKNNLKHNAIGLRITSSLDRFDTQPVIFMRTGRKCLGIFSCGLTGSYNPVTKQPKISAGIVFMF